MDPEDKKMLFETHEMTRQVHEFVFGVQGQGGLNRRIQAHEEDDARRFNTIDKDLQDLKKTKWISYGIVIGVTGLVHTLAEWFGIKNK